MTVTETLAPTQAASGAKPAASCCAPVADLGHRPVQLSAELVSVTPAERSCCAHMSASSAATPGSAAPTATPQKAQQLSSPAPAAHAACCHPAAASTATPAAPTNLWRTAAANTLVCLVGCSLGDVGVVVASRVWSWPLAMVTLMVIAIAAGLATSIALETVWLRTGSKMPWPAAFQRAAGMSLISMVAMEIAMNTVDLGLTGGMRMALPWTQYLGILALGEIAGFLVPLPYNWYRLRYYGKACH